MSDEVLYTSYPVFRLLPVEPEKSRSVAVKEALDLFEEFASRISIRGFYSTVGLSARADLMMWWLANDPEDLQELTVRFRNTALGKRLETVEQFLGLVRPAEFSPNHRPAFLEGREPQRYLCLYPYVRTSDWYLLPPEERARMLREHGEAAAPFPDVWANTTSAFGLGDYEWILAFEAPSAERIVDLLRRLRGVEARRYTQLETPFFTGVRKSLEQAAQDLNWPEG